MEHVIIASIIAVAVLYLFTKTRNAIKTEPNPDSSRCSGCTSACSAHKK